jgi:predicted ArsR family transcriptional regulator
MAVKSRAEEKIIELLKTEGSMSVEELVEALFDDYQITEREVKETILKLREEGQIQPDHQWKMEYVA